MNELRQQSSRGGYQGADEREDPATFWERRYGGAEAVWSGKVNVSLADAVSGLKIGRSLDLGCGEGGDVLWLAARGWRATGIDLSRTAISRATIRAAELGLTDADFIASDLALWVEQSQSVDRGDEQFDLITASFLQSPVELPRALILRAALTRLAPGGSLVLVSHASAPSWAKHDHAGEREYGRGNRDSNDGHDGHFGHDSLVDGAGAQVNQPTRLSGHGEAAGVDSVSVLPAGQRRSAHGFLTPAHELSALGLLSPEFEVVVAELRKREVFAPDGNPAQIDDSVVIVRRSAA